MTKAMPAKPAKIEVRLVEYFAKHPDAVHTGAEIASLMNVARTSAMNKLGVMVHHGQLRVVEIKNNARYYGRGHHHSAEPPEDARPKTPGRFFGLAPEPLPYNDGGLLLQKVWMTPPGGATIGRCQTRSRSR